MCVCVWHALLLESEWGGRPYSLHLSRGFIVCFERRPLVIMQDCLHRTHSLYTQAARARGSMCVLLCCFAKQSASKVSESDSTAEMLMRSW